MNIFKEQQTIKFETVETENLKTGARVVTAVSIQSSNGLFYKITNKPKSKSLTNLYLTYNGKILMNGNLNASAYRADSFVNCADHVLFKLDKDDIEYFVNQYKDKGIGTLFVKDDVSGVWLHRKVNYLREDNVLGIVTQEQAPKYRKPSVMEDFLYKNTTIKKRASLQHDIKNNLIIYKIKEAKNNVLFFSMYNKSTGKCVYKFKNEPEQVVEGLDPSKYKVLLNDCLIKWAINNPKDTFETIVNDYLFTDDMTYKQVQKMLKMIKI